HPADAVPVHEANVGIVDHAETKRDGSRRLRLAQLEARAVPRDAIQPLVADLLPPARYGYRAPSRIIQLGIGPDGAAALHTGVRGGQLAADALAQRRAELLLAVALRLHDLTVGVLAEAQRLRAHPRLDAAAAPGALDDADGHVDVFAQLAREEESDGREGADVLGQRPLPLAARELILGLRGPRVRHLEVADGRIRAGGNLLLGIHRAGHLPLHVGLPRGHPHVAEQDVFEAMLLVARSDGQYVRPARRHLGERHQPEAVLGGRGRQLYITQSHLHVRPGRGPSPHGHLRLALHHHVVAEEARNAEAVGSIGAPVVRLNIRRYGRVGLPV